MDASRSLDQAFRELETAFHRLRRLYLSRKISQQEFIAELKKLRVRDERGKYWTLGAQSGKWYCFDGRNWIRADPPLSESDWNERKAEAQPGVSESLPSEMTLMRAEKEEMEPRPHLFSPEVSSLTSSSSGEEISSSAGWWVFSSLPLSSASLFFGGIGTLLGIGAGAVIGSTSFFSGKMNFLPLFLQDIQGKLAGGMIFAILGGVLGFLWGALSGLLTALIFNLTSSLTGGLSIYGRLKSEEEKRRKKGSEATLGRS